MGRWDERVELVADLIPLGGGQLLDVGMGDGVLETLLPPHWEYRGVDLPELDLNEPVGLWPDLGSFDLVILSGVLEYVTDPRAALGALHRYGQQMILSYETAAVATDRVRKSGWPKRPLTKAKLVKMLGETGWRVSASTSWTTQVIFVLEPS